MPTVLNINGFRFFFYSNEDDEPVHIHIEKSGGSAKYWLHPIKEAYSYGFSVTDRKKIKELVTEHQNVLKNAWNEYFKN